jgi:hypothetical protein
MVGFFGVKAQHIVNESGLMRPNSIREPICNATYQYWKEVLSGMTLVRNPRLFYFSTTQTSAEPPRSRRIIGKDCETDALIEWSFCRFIADFLLLFKGRSEVLDRRGTWDRTQIGTDYDSGSYRVPDVAERHLEAQMGVPVFSKGQWSINGNVNLYPWSVCGLKLPLHDSHLLLGSIGLRLHLAQCSERINGGKDSGDDANTFKRKSRIFYTGFFWTITFLGCVVVMYGWWKANRGLNVNLMWWLLLMAFGAMLIVYGVNQLLDMPQKLEQSAPQLSVIHAVNSVT